jgi:PAS domain S-box-containing protein
MLSDAKKLALYQAVFDEIPDVVLLKDGKGDFLLCNQTVARLYGTTPDAMVGKHDDDFGVPKALADGYRANVLGIMARGQTEIVFEDSRDAVTGELRHFKSIKRPFKDAEGNDQILVIAHDITDVVRAQQRVAQSEFTLQQVMKATQEGIWDWDVPSGHLAHNERWFGILGFEEGEIDDHVEAFSRQLHPEDKAMVWDRIQRLLDGSDAHYASEHRMLKKDGSVIWVLDRGRVVQRDENGHAVRVVGAYSDITERKHSQVALEQALLMAQAATKAKSEFLATMSHELRTPMNGVLGMAQLLTSSAISDAQRIEYAGVILRSGEALLALLNDILDLSRVEAGCMELTASSFSPAALVAETLDAFREPAARKGLQLQLNEAAMPQGTYMGDPFRLRQMLSNYLNNAVKFTQQGHIAVTVSEELDPAGRCMLEFAVIDTGVGLPLDKRHLLFQPFSQLDGSTTRQYGGSGLGLSIVARLAELMGGEVGASSLHGQGSRFWFRIPAPRQADPVPGGPRGLPRLAQQQFDLPAPALVAEDNPVNREVMGLLLANLGVKVEFAEDGQAAVNAIASGRSFAIVLMDVQMPVLDGLAAARRIRQWEAQHSGTRVPIVAVSSGVFEDQKRQCVEAGMDDFVGKPVLVEELAAALSRWCR